MNNATSDPFLRSTRFISWNVRKDLTLASACPREAS